MVQQGSSLVNGWARDLFMSSQLGGLNQVFVMNGTERVSTSRAEYVWQFLQRTKANSFEARAFSGVIGSIAIKRVWNGFSRFEIRHSLLDCFRNVDGRTGHVQILKFHAGYGFPYPYLLANVPGHRTGVLGIRRAVQELLIGLFVGSRRVGRNFALRSESGNCGTCFVPSTNGILFILA